MFRLFGLLLVGLVVFSAYNPQIILADSLGLEKKCVFELYQFRSPVIEGCALTYNSDGLFEHYTFLKKGQFGSAKVYTGVPGYGPQPGDADVFVKQKCPISVTQKIDKMFEDTEIQSFEGAKSFIIRYANEFIKSDVKVATITLTKGGKQIVAKASLPLLSLETFSIKLEPIKGPDEFFYGALDNGMTVKFRDSRESTLSLLGDVGAFDYRGGCG